MMKNQEVKKSMETKENESGRSMVEMLGVLAIMGVLAIGGIAGYRWAMDKYNANEILNEVRKRAITASQQRILGHAINLSEYGNNGQIQGKYAVTTADKYNGDANFFTITVKGIEQNICEKVLAGTIPFAIDTWVGAYSDECVGENNDMTFLFKNTLDSERPAEWETTAAMTTEEIALTEMATASSLFSGSSEYTVSGSDGIWSTEPESFSSSGSSEYTVSGSDGIWGTVTDSGYRPEESGTVTVTAIQVKSCSSNEDCINESGERDKTQYCHIVDYTRTGSTDACYTNLRGTCRDKGAALTDTNSIKIKDDSGKTLMMVWKGPRGTWWSARNWCAAHRKQLVDISNNRLGCYKDDGKTPFEATTKGYCCAKDQASCGSTVGNQSELMQALRAAYGSGKLPDYFWTATPYPYNSTSDNSCHAFDVSLYSGYVDGHSRYNGTIYALCAEVVVGLGFEKGGETAAF